MRHNYTYKSASQLVHNMLYYFYKFIMLLGIPIALEKKYQEIEVAVMIIIIVGIGNPMRMIMAIGALIQTDLIGGR